MRRRILLAGIALPASGCGPGRAAAPSAAQVRGAAALRPVAAYGDSCGPVIAHARRVPGEPLILPPVPAATVGLLPPRIPAKVRRHATVFTLALTVDSVGGVTDVQVAPEVSPEFTAQLVAQYRRVRMAPALLHGCGVPSRTTLTVEYTKSQPGAG